VSSVIAVVSSVVAVVSSVVAVVSSRACRGTATRSHTGGDHQDARRSLPLDKLGVTNGGASLFFTLRRVAARYAASRRATLRRGATV
jgi:hypothetical protein